MHCPFCGTPMEMRDGWLTCPRVHEGVSERVARELTEIATTPPSPARCDTVMDTTGPWHCPADGQRMAVAPGKLPQCPRCDRVLPKALLYQLVEIHGHMRADHDSAVRVTERRLWGRFTGRRHG